MSAYASVRQQVMQTRAYPPEPIRQHTSAYVSIRQHTPAYGSIWQRTSAGDPDARIIAGAYTSAYVSICQHTPAYASICQQTPARTSAGDPDAHIYIYIYNKVAVLNIYTIYSIV
jgi:hypothetical protein